MEFSLFKINWRAECKTMLSDNLKCFSFFCKSAWNIACHFQLNRNTTPCIFLAVLLFVFEILRLQKTCFLSRQHVTPKSKTAKKIQGVVFLFNWKRHAKFQALLQKTEKHLRSSLSMVLHSALQLRNDAFHVKSSQSAKN